MNRHPETAAPTTPSKGLRRAWAGAVGGAGGLAMASGSSKDVGATLEVGTEHLLLGLTGDKHSMIGSTLADFHLTRRAVVAVLRSKAEESSCWSSRDAAEGAPAEPPSGDLQELLEALADKRGLFNRRRKRRITTHPTPAARMALLHGLRQTSYRGRDRLDIDDVLLGLVADGSNRAVETLSALEVSPEALGARVRTVIQTGDADGSPTSERHDAPNDEGDDDLQLTRSVLFGQATYPETQGLRWSGLRVLDTLGINWAELPVPWVFMEARECARHLGDARVGTDHVLLGMLSTHQVARPPAARARQHFRSLSGWTGSRRVRRQLPRSQRHPARPADRHGPTE